MGLEMIDTVAFEQALTAWFAARLDLTVDAEIFRGALPVGESSAAAVIIDGSTVYDDIRPTEYNVQILGRYEDRDDACRLLDGVAALVPAYGVVVGDCRLAYLLTVGTGMPYVSGVGGTLRYYASYNLRCAPRPIRI